MGSRKQSDGVQLGFALLESMPLAAEGATGAEVTAEPAAALAVDRLAAAVPSAVKARSTAAGRHDKAVVDLVERVEAMAAVAVTSPQAPDRYPGASAEHALTVNEFYDRVKWALRGQFPEEVWVTGEIRKVSVSKGNRYIELADHPEAGRAASGATVDVSCWSRDWPRVGSRLQSVGLSLVEGMVVRLRGRVGIWEGAAKVRFSMTDIDVEALLGGIAANRRKLVLQLEAEGLLGANKLLPTPVVPLRVALVTAESSEAYRDFTGQLERSSYAFDVRLFASLVQGTDAHLYLASAIRRAHSMEPDVIVIVRGGGARADLAAFDNADVARSIASSKYPVWTGVGHTGDQSVADEVAQRALITPTACGQAIVARVRQYLDDLADRSRLIGSKGRFALDLAARHLDDRKTNLARASRHELDQASASVSAARSRARHGAILVLERQEGALRVASGQLASISRHAVSSAAERVGGRRAMLDAYDPKRQLARGWSLTRSADGGIVRSAEELQPGQRIVTILRDGVVASIVETATGSSIEADGRVEEH